jgi:voltage-gated potassium channel Kch
MIGERLRYAFDNFMARGTGALIVGLLGLSTLLILGVATLVTLAGFVRGANDADLDFPQAVWVSLLRTLDPGTMGGDTGQPGFLLAMLVVTLGGVFVVATLIGVISSGIDGRLASLRRGRSRVVERDHTVILGWSPTIFSVLTELVEANANRRRAVVVVLADKDKVEMEEEIRARIPSARGTKVVCRSGSPIDRQDIRIASVRTARSIIVLSPTTDDPDSDVIKTLLAIVNDPDGRATPYHIVAELRDPANLAPARMVGQDMVVLAMAGDLTARIAAQACRQPGLAVVYSELLDFSGDEIYFSRQPALAGRTFGDALLAFEDSSLIGISRDGGGLLLNPPMDTVLEAADELVVISADDDTIVLADHAITPTPGDIVDEGPLRRDPERTLILGWNRWALEIVRELDRYLAPGSETTVVCDRPEVAATLTTLAKGGMNARLAYRPGQTTSRSLLDSLDVDGYQHVILLGDADRLDAQRADARTLVTLLHLRDIASRSAQPFTIVSEMLDPRNGDLAKVAQADDFIVSDHLVSLYLTQVAEDKRLAAVFADILDAEHSEIYLRPVAGYVRPDTEIRFATIVEAARRRGQVAIGYRQRAAASDPARDYGVVVNPRKSEPVRLAPDDDVIVIAQD